MSTLYDSLQRSAKELEYLVARIEDLEREVVDLRRRIDRTDDKLYELQTEFN